MSETQPMVTFTLAPADAQLVMTILQQALLPYQRLAQVMQEMQRQGMQQQGSAPATRADIPTQALRPNGPDFQSQLAHAQGVANP